MVNLDSRINSYRKLGWSEKKACQTSQSQCTENLVVTEPALVQMYWKGKLMLPFQTVLGGGSWAETGMQTRAYCWLDTATTELPLHCESPSLLRFIWFRVVRHRQPSACSLISPAFTSSKHSKTQGLLRNRSHGATAVTACTVTLEQWRG